MKHIRRIHALSNFLSGLENDEDQICRFIVLDSCSDLRAVSAVLAKLENDGSRTRQIGQRTVTAS